MTMLLKANPNTFRMTYIFSEDVQAGELRSDLHQAHYTAHRAEEEEKPVSAAQRMADEAWERFAARQAQRQGKDRLAAAMREMCVA